MHKLLKRFIVANSLCASLMGSAAAQTDNPLLQKDFGTPFEAAPYDKIKPVHFLPAIEEGIKLGKADIDAIINNPDAPTFANTIEALEGAGSLLSRNTSIFYHLNGAETSPEIQKIAKDISPMLSEYGNDITLNERLFARVKQVYEQRQTLSLTKEQQMLLENTYKSFSRNGANLEGADKEKLRAINKELSELGLRFGENVLNETNEFMLVITDKKDLEGLPENTIHAAASLAKQKGQEGKWIFTLQAPSYVPFMTYAQNRELREKLYKAYNTRATKDGASDNRPVAMRIAQLRYEKAKLLGYRTYADFVLEERMAQSTERVNGFLNELRKHATPVAEQEIKELKAFMKKKGVKHSLQPWDWSYYSEQLKEEKYNISAEALRPYFKLENVLEGAFSLASKLYHVSFKERHDIPVWHKDVKVFEVLDAQGQHLALFYADFFPRAGKRPGAWMNSITDQHIADGKNIRPHVINVCNFTMPTEDKPSLLNMDEVRTLFHEFGHGLHGILANTTYGSLSGTSVYRDFVELPSQILENWAVEDEMLKMYAKHYQTGEVIPADMVSKLQESNLYHAGYATMRQLTFGLLDMAWHSIEAPKATTLNEFEKSVKSVADFEGKAIASTQLFPKVPGALISAQFSHIFAGGYAAGYYSYKWAEVLDADAFSVFKQKGLFDQQTAKSFYENILSKGGTEHPMELYKRFRGQEPGVEALLERSGFLKKPAKQ